MELVTHIFRSGTTPPVPGVRTSPEVDGYRSFRIAAAVSEALSQGQPIQPLPQLRAATTTSVPRTDCDSLPVNANTCNDLQQCYKDLRRQLALNPNKEQFQELRQITSKTGDNYFSFIWDVRREHISKLIRTAQPGSN